MKTFALLLACSAVASATWQQLGAAQPHEHVTAMSMDFNFDGFPVFAFGYNASAGNTQIPILAWNGTGWVQEAERRAQFPQGYHEFIFKVRYGVNYVGLKIHYRYGSVLNGGVEYRGCYAFHNQLFNFEITPTGDMQMLWISESKTTSSYPGTGNKLSIVKYPRSGWRSYPAANHFDKLNFVAQQTETERVTDVKMVPGQQPGSYYGAYVLAEKVYVFNDTKTYEPLGGAFPAAGGLDVLYTEQHGLLLSVMSKDRNFIEVYYLHPEGRWQQIGSLFKGSLDKKLVKTHIGVSRTGYVVVAALDATQKRLSFAKTKLSDPTKWGREDLVPGDSISHWEMRVSGETAYAILSENYKGVRAFRKVIE